jgi:hypothetical protein
MEVKPTRWGLSKEGYPSGGYDPEQEARWAKEKQECLDRHMEKFLAEAADWLDEVKYQEKRRANRVEQIRKKYPRHLKAILDRVRE